MEEDIGTMRSIGLVRIVILSEDKILVGDKVVDILYSEWSYIFECFNIYTKYQSMQYIPLIGINDCNCYIKLGDYYFRSYLMRQDHGNRSIDKFSITFKSHAKAFGIIVFKINGYTK